MPADPRSPGQGDSTRNGLRARCGHCGRTAIAFRWWKFKAEFSCPCGRQWTEALDA